MHTEIGYDRDPLENQNSIYSIGTGLAMNAFEKQYVNYKTGIVAINVATLLRNWQAKDVSSFAMVTLFGKEFPILMEEITAIMQRDNPANNPCVIIYAVDMVKCIPEPHRRNATETLSKLNKAVEMILSRKKELFGANQRGYFNNIEVSFVDIIQSHPYVYNKLWNAVQEKTTHRSMIMISHSPIDYHISRYVDNVMVLESHTGIFRKMYEMPKKVFGERYLMIPFNPATHVCLGDTKGGLKPNLSPKEKKQLLEVAVSDKWLTKSYNHILQRIGKMFPSVDMFMR